MKKLLLYVMAGAMLAACGGNGRQQEEETAVHDTVTLSNEQVERLQITTAPLREYCFSAAVKASGRLAVSPQSMATITTKVGANIERILVEEGGRVGKGQVVAWLSSAELTEMQSRYATAVSRRDYLAKEYERQRQMMAEQVGAGKDYDRAQTDWQSACREADMLAAQLQQMGVSGAAKAVGRIALHSPIAGTVEHITVQTGQYTAPDTPMMRIVNTDHVYADLLVFQRDIGKVQTGQLVRLTAGDSREFSGSVSSVANTFSDDVQAVHVRVGIDADNGQGLIAGMYVEGLIATDSIRQPAVSEEAVTEADGKTYIFAAERQGDRWLFTPVEVKRGREEDGMVAVTPADSAARLSSVAQRGAYYIISEMKKGETGEE